jgi:hypothetical protein
MPARLFPARTIKISVCLTLALLAIDSPALAQRPDAGGMQMPGSSGNVSVAIAVRDIQGVPPAMPANVHLYSLTTGYDASSITGGTSDAVFSVPPGDYRVEVRCDGYQPATDEVGVPPMGTETYFPVLLKPAPLKDSSNSHVHGTVMTPQLQQIISKGLDAMHQLVGE